MYCGIDLGTSGVKLVLLNQQQKIIAQATQSLTVDHPQPLWSEQDPEEWWAATRRAVADLRRQHPVEFSAIKAIGFSGQQHGATLLDTAGKVLRSAMLWNDGRAFAQCQELEERVPEYTAITGNRIMPGFTAPKVLWVAQHEPQIFQKIHKILLPKDYLRLKISGDYATDVSDASGTAWLNVADRKWSSAMLAACDLTEAHMPALFEGSAITGKVTHAIAAEWGISPATVVVGGGGDNPAAAISVNVIKPGSAFLSLGTSGVYFVSADRFQANPERCVHSFGHCLPNYWHHMAVHLNAAACLSWLAKIVQVNDPQMLVQEAEKNSALENPVVFLPYLSGERTPHNNPHAKGVFFGLTNSSERADLTRAVLEGVAFAFADGQDAMLDAGIRIDEVSVVGGGAQSIFWGTILSAVLQRPLIYRSHAAVGAALGAARLAWLAVNPCDPERAFTTPPIERIIEPDVGLITHYQKKRVTFRNLYQRIEELF